MAPAWRSTASSPASLPAERGWLRPQTTCPLRRRFCQAGQPGLRAPILATTIGPKLLIAGSVATLITRRIARDAGAGLSAWRFTAIGLVLVPAQLTAATIGLHIAGTFSARAAVLVSSGPMEVALLTARAMS